MFENLSRSQRMGANVAGAGAGLLLLLGTNSVNAHPHEATNVGNVTNYQSITSSGSLMANTTGWGVSLSAEGDIEVTGDFYGNGGGGTSEITANNGTITIASTFYHGAQGLVVLTSKYEDGDIPGQIVIGAVDPHLTHDRSDVVESVLNRSEFYTNNGTVILCGESLETNKSLSQRGNVEVNRQAQAGLEETDIDKVCNESFPYRNSSSNSGTSVSALLAAAEQGAEIEASPQEAKQQYDLEVAYAAQVAADRA